MAKLQSAMEYLMTYGWAILAIAIVMVSLYSLGIFNTGSLQPTATPGSCEVVRTAAETSLAGQCNNLIPKYIGQFSATSYAFVNTNSIATNLAAKNAVTEVIWINLQSFPNTYPTILSVSGAQLGLQNVTGTSGYVRPCVAGTCLISSNTISTGQWTMLSYTYDQQVGKVMIYINGRLSDTYSRNASLGTHGVFCMGVASSTPFVTCGINYPMAGFLANAQIYNTSLDNTSILALYREGIGGTPIDIQHLVAWYPLNGNINDYSGNNYQGTQTKVVWNANWQSGYTAPTT